MAKIMRKYNLRPRKQPIELEKREKQEVKRCFSKEKVERWLDTISDHSFLNFDAFEPLTQTRLAFGITACGCRRQFTWEMLPKKEILYFTQPMKPSCVSSVMYGTTVNFGDMNATLNTAIQFAKSCSVDLNEVVFAIYFWHNLKENAMCDLVVTRYVILDLNKILLYPKELCKCQLNYNGLCIACLETHFILNLEKIPILSECFCVQIQVSTWAESKLNNRIKYRELWTGRMAFYAGANNSNDWFKIINNCIGWAFLVIDETKKNGIQATYFCQWCKRPGNGAMFMCPDCTKDLHKIEGIPVI